MKNTINISIIIYSLCLSMNIMAQDISKNKKKYVSNLFGYDFLFNDHDNIIKQLKKQNFHYDLSIEYTLDSITESKSVLKPKILIDVNYFTASNYEVFTDSDSVNCFSVTMTFPNEKQQSKQFDKALNGILRMFTKKEAIRLISFTKESTFGSVYKIQLTEAYLSPILILRKINNHDNLLNIALIKPFNSK